MDYGTATFRHSDDGGLEVVDADPVIGISLELLSGDRTRLVVDVDGCVLLGGEPDYRYRPVGFAPAGGPARVMVCERVTG